MFAELVGFETTHLCQIFNRSLTTAEVPLNFRSADVWQIPQKRSPQGYGNYRPISLTSVPGKVLESIIMDRMANFLETNNLINTSHNGFRQGRSFVTNLLDFYQYMFCECDRSSAEDVVFLDFRKAFNKDPHKRLMRKVRALGIQGNVAALIENWLAGRRQRVIVNGVHSDRTAVSSGVPQWSVLGQLLFVIYINDQGLGKGILQPLEKGPRSGRCLQPRQVPCPARGHRQSGGELFLAWFGDIQCGQRN